MQVPHGLASLFSTVDHKAVALVSKAFPSGNLGGCKEQACHIRGVLGSDIVQAADMPLGDDQYVGWCLGVDVPEGQDVFIVVYLCAWYAAANDGTEQT